MGVSRAVRGQEAGSTTGKAAGVIWCAECQTRDKFTHWRFVGGRLVHFVPHFNPHSEWLEAWQESLSTLYAKLNPTQGVE